MAVVLDALASYIQNMLTEMAKEQVVMLFGVSGEIDKMDSKLRDLKNILADADRKNITDMSVKEWVRELRDVMYDATDILDLCQLKAMKHGPRLSAGCFNPLLFCMRHPMFAHDIGSRIQNLNQRLDGIKDRSSAFNFINLSSYENRRREVPSYSPTSRETSGELDESGLVGDKIEEDTRKLVQMLIHEEATDIHLVNKINVFAIVGTGGIGKTTLAQKVFNNEIIQQEFAKRIWLSVNQEFNDAELLKGAISQTMEVHQATGNAKVMLERTLKEALKGKKILLVMDDVWNHRAWEGVLKTPLVNSLAPGSRVLLTTRDNKVARGMKAEEPYHQVHKLEPEDAWCLLKKQVVRNVSDEPEIDMLKDVGMGIIEKCDCLPLAVKVMGGLLCQKKRRRDDWEKVLSNYMWPVSKMPEEINYAIYLSYEDLPSPLKQCFLHFSLIPKGLTLSVDNIVSMWISEGFVHGSTKLEEVGSEYHDELISRNLIEPDKKHVNPHCTMHDVIRSFAQYVAKDEALVANNREIDVTSKLTSHKLFRLSLHTVGLESNQLIDWSSLEVQKSLRTLLSFGPLKTKRGDTLGIFPSLRTLFLDGTDCRALVESLYQLKHLRYLCMDGCGLSKLPENIGKMKFLQCIDISNNKSLAKLPDSFVELHQLRFLVLYNTGISNIPKGFHRLNNLMTLAGFPAHMNGEWCSLEELGPLSQLRDLTIKGLENVDASSYARKARINGKLHLRHLNLNCSTRQGDDAISEEEQRRIEGVFDELCPPPCLEILAIIGYFGSRLPRWMMSIASGLPRSIRTLLMNDLACCTELPGGLCQLPFLEEVRIRSAPAIKRVGPTFLQPYHHGDGHAPQPQVVTSFPRLLKLRFGGMLVWEEWEWEEQVQAMPNLEVLTLERCKLRSIPPGLAFQAKSLRLLCVHNVKHLSSLENLSSVVQLHVLQCHDLERIENLWKLQKLRINTCPKMKVLKGVPALERLGLEDYTMKTLPGYLQDVKPRHFELEDCTLLLLTAIAAAIAAGRSGPEWDKFGHIQHVKAYAAEDCIPRKRFVLYTRDPFSFETNASSSDIARVLLYTKTCTIEDECLVGGQYANENKCQPLCLRFRWNSYRHLSSWLSQVCLHCKDAACVVSSSGPE